jgi:Cys-tRNA synthase (O-phospho-L-seryl-tRNA:Cys-tRNA synthase)
MWLVRKARIRALEKEIIRVRRELYEINLLLAMFEEEGGPVPPVKIATHVDESVSVLDAERACDLLKEYDIPLDDCIDRKAEA